VHVIPWGVSRSLGEEPAPPLPLATRKRLKFLFVGGTIERKGIDLLLKTYTQVFSDKDDVCLVIKDMGVGTFYRGQTAEEMIAQARQTPHAPEIEYLSRELSDEELAGLYRACDCLVQPFRGEGFGLPIIEAMALGLPVIVTGFGPTLDYCTPETAYLVPGRNVPFRQERVGDMETVGAPWWAEPEEALRACAQGAALYPRDTEILFVAALARHDLGDLSGAIACMERVLDSREGDHFRSIAVGLDSFKARHKLGTYYKEAGRSADAERQWRVALEEHPAFTPSRLLLGDLFRAQGRWQELTEVMEVLERRSQTLLDAALFRGRWQLAQRRFDEARKAFEDLCTRYPTATGPWIFLSHTLLQKDSDPQAAQRALTKVLELDPRNAEARHNLEVLRRRL
jgi:Flp pilus assembly protein TadD